MRDIAIGLYKWLVGTTLGVWVALPMSIHFLLGFIALDLLTGLIAGFIQARRAPVKTGKAPEEFFTSIAKKVLMLIMVATAHMVTIALDIKFADLGSGVAIAYTIHEVMTIARNCSRAGLQVPAILTDALMKIQEEKDPSAPVGTLGKSTEEVL